LFSPNLILQIVSWLIGDKGLANLAAPNAFEFLAGLFIILVFLHFEYKIYLNWNEPVSLRQHNKDKLKEKTTIVNLISDAAAVAIRDKELVVYRPDEHDIYEDFDFKEEKEICWNIQAAEILQLISKQYKINVKNDWYSEESCYISRYGKNNDLLGIYCTQNYPGEGEIDRFIEVVKKHKIGNESIYKLVIAVKNGKFEKKVTTIQDINVEFRFEKEMLDQLVDFSDYQAFIDEFYEKKEIMDGYGVAIRDLFTEPDCTLRKYNSKNEAEEVVITNIEKYINDWLKDRKERKHIAILGEYGQGKTVLALHLAYKLLKNPKRSRIPILIELRGKYPKQSDKLTLLSDFAKDYGIEPKALLKLHYAGRLLLIFEGFDEMEMVGDFSVLYNHFKSLWAFSTQGSKIIITGRTNFFTNIKEQQAFLISQKQLDSMHYTEEIYLNRFDKTKIERALRHAPDAIRFDIMSILEKEAEDSSFFDLMSRPSLLFLASIVWKDRNLSAYKENINSALVIKEFLLHSYSRQHEKDIDTPLTVRERAYFILGIAVGMVQKSGYTNQVSQSSLRSLIKKLSEDFPDEISELKSLSTKKILPLKERFDTKYAEETVFLDIRSCGILVRDLATSDSFKFAHKSFLELLVSDFLVIRLLKSRSDENSFIMANAVNRSLNLKKADIDRTHEITKFIAQLLANTLEFDQSYSYKKKAEAVFKMLNRHLFLPMRFNFFNNIVYSIGGNIKRVKMRRHVFIFFRIWTTSVFLIFFLSFLFSMAEHEELLHQFIKRDLFMGTIIIGGGIFAFFFFSIYSIGRFFWSIGKKESLQTDFCNIKLWFLVCKELKIPDKVMLELMPEGMFKMLNQNAKDKDERGQK
jgi:hypothetical protein